MTRHLTDVCDQCRLGYQVIAELQLHSQKTAPFLLALEPVQVVYVHLFRTLQLADICCHRVLRRIGIDDPCFPVFHDVVEIVTRTVI